MAPKLLFLLLLWPLTLFNAVASLCKVTCSTDYIKTLNCSCSGSVPTLPVLLDVICRDEDEHFRGSCTVTPPQSWCTIVNEDLNEVTTIGTNCTTTVGHLGSDASVDGPESTVWVLSDMVKPEAPVNVKVTNDGDFYNITWSKNNLFHELVYKVRIRTAAHTEKVQRDLFPVDEEYLLIDLRKLQPDVVYTVDVQAQMSPGFYLKGPWSEWSSGVEWRSVRVSANETRETSIRINVTWLYVSMPILLVLTLLLVGYLQKPCWQKKLRMITYIPRPNEYFKPLYHNHEGNFKEWVKPVFTEFDCLMINTSMLMGEKPDSLLHWNIEKQSYDVDEMKEGGAFLHVLQASGNLLQDSSGSQSTGNSTGRISIQTVTLSGGEVASQSSLESYQDGESFGSFAEADREHAGYDLEDLSVSRRNRQSGFSLQRENQIANDLLMENINYEEVQFNEAERASLDSFESNEQSEDGYPRVDLDTIDSGYGECSSPGALDSNQAQQMDSFQQHKNSSYVKQWMICSTIQEDPSNVSDETQEP
ncbi:interleukin 21 receptor, tandem duplicate 1 [Nothobranchius furzeri]|uniref:Interleukin-21 receptor-like n=1 Tax=Nothobranchius furzeri TaxID=105023 RepID=A0A8C6KQI4_NOTFU|nr:interleukin-21 receptor-like [Nothobranchius furzeri]